MQVVCTQTTAPTEFPVTVVEAAEHLRLDGVTEYPLIQRLIAAATRVVEEREGVQLCTATWLQTIDDRFPGYANEIVLERYPVQDINYVKYIDINGTLTTLPTTDYDALVTRRPPVVRPAYNLSWPATRKTSNAVQIEFDAGYLSTALIPQSTKTAILSIVHYLNEVRGEESGGTAIDDAVRDLLNADTHARFV